MQLMQASMQWMMRPDDERYIGDGTTLGALWEMFHHMRDFHENAREVVVEGNGFQAIADGENLSVVGKNAVPYAPTHYAFSQMATLAGAPPNYLRRLPATLAAECINHGLSGREEKTQLLLNKKTASLAALTGENYGRIWNDQVINGLVYFVENNPSWKIPGVFGQEVPVTKETTTLFASDHDFFVFLADEENRVKFSGRRGGEEDRGLARGFFVRNSMVGDCTFSISMFLFDFACSNRIVWGAENFQQIKIRHSKSAPERWFGEAQDALESYRQSAVAPLETALNEARTVRLDDKRQQEILAPLVGIRTVPKIRDIFEAEEFRPMETTWDLVTGLTAYARGINHQDQRVALELEAGKILGKFLPRALPAPEKKKVVPVASLDF